MTTFITLFVAIQLFLGFCALITAMRQSPGDQADDSDFQRVRLHRN